SGWPPARNGWLSLIGGRRWSGGVAGRDGGGADCGVVTAKRLPSVPVAGVTLPAMIGLPDAAVCHHELGGVRRRGGCDVCGAAAAWGPREGWCSNAPPTADIKKLSSSVYRCASRPVGRFVASMKLRVRPPLSLHETNLSLRPPSICCCSV